MFVLGIAIYLMLMVALIGIPTMLGLALYQYLLSLYNTYIVRDPINNINHEPHYWTDAAWGAGVVIVTMMVIGVGYATLVAH
jgi:hypothetical protein